MSALLFGLTALGVLVGEASMLLDIGSRMFGSYVRSLFGTSLRILLLTVLCLALMAPLYLAQVFPERVDFRVLAYVSGVAGAVLLFHHLVPRRHGIRRVTREMQVRSVRSLCAGVELRECVVPLESLPADHDGFTILVISDVHCRNERGLELLKKAVSALSESDEKVDCAVMLGDFGEKASLLPHVVAALESVPSRLGMFCVRGNHDFEGGREGIIEDLLRNSSIRLLRNQAHSLPGTQIALAGCENPWRRGPAPASEAGMFALALTHCPDNVLLLHDAGVRLVLAGHTHGGRIRLPFVGSLLVPNRLGRFLDEGLFQIGATRLFITSGIGYFPGRPGNRGEIVRLVLRRPENVRSASQTPKNGGTEE